MTELSNGTIVTDLDAHDDNLSLSQRGYSIRHIETWHERDNNPSSTGTRQNSPKPTFPTEHGNRGRPARVGPFARTTRPRTTPADARRNHCNLQYRSRDAEIGDR